MRAIQEQITHPERSFRVLDLELPAFRGQRHRHHALELTWIRRGWGLRQVGDQVEAFEDGDLVLLGPQVPHNWTSDARCKGAPLQATVLQFPAEWLLQPPLPELRQAAPLLADSARGLAVVGDCRDRLVPLLYELPRASPLDALALSLHVLSLLAEHCDSLRPIARAAVGRPRLTQPVQRRIDPVIDWIHRRLADPLTVEEAAQHAHVTPQAFSRFFKREVGRTFTAYVNDMRCSQAALLLRHTTRPVEWVAAQCGFESASNFQRRFRERMGSTPSAFRRG